MEKIKCPFCGEEIKSDSRFCPNCGRELDSIKETDNEDVSFSHAVPSDSSWVSKWKSRDMIFKCVFTLLFIMCVALHFVFMSKYRSLENTHDIKSLDEKVNSGMMMYICGYGSIFFRYYVFICDFKI